jgi:DNA-directed RNA polymerase II subunit RPB2
MGKQAIGIYALNYAARMDKTGYILSHPMRPLVTTRLMGVLKLDNVPSGCMVIVAIMTHTGYNQEDSILFNEGSVNRGLFEATITSTIRDEDKRVQGDEEVRGRPVVGQTKGLKFANYEHIGEDGLVKENTRVRNRDIIIGKTAPIKSARNDPSQNIKYTDCSHMLRTTETSYIDKNYTNRNGDGYTFCKVRVRTLRCASIGDKFSSRHGQKGTMGNIIPEVDMPYTQSGIKPDISINPHAIPSRMTIAQLKETLLGKLLLELGMLGDGTSFGNLSVDTIRKKLMTEGLESTGEEIMYDGQTGEQMESSVFIGPVFYQRLKHMVKDKIHSRSYGPKVSLTRQPAEGRRRDGGHRFGEMERDCMCSHGAASFTTSRMMDASDAFTTYCCRKCGSFAIFNNTAHVHECRVCGNSTDFAKIRIPYSCKLLFQELVTMNVAPRILTE